MINLYLQIQLQQQSPLLFVFHVAIPFASHIWTFIGVIHYKDLVVASLGLHRLNMETQECRHEIATVDHPYTIYEKLPQIVQLMANPTRASIWLWDDCICGNINNKLV